MKTPRILDLLNRPWAITEGKLTEMVGVYERHAAGEKFDVEGMRAAIADRSGDGSDETSYEVDNGVAIIPVEGVLSKRMNMFAYFSGGTSTQVLGAMITRAAADPSVHSLLLQVDSPGGEVDGTQVCADAVTAAAQQKPVVAWLDGLCASAAYWIASMAGPGNIYIADTTTQVGSIGVVATHVDRSKANEDSGRKVTEITAGKYKRIASTHAPLTQEGRQSVQDDVDYLYSLFVGAVAAGRGTDVDTVLTDMADGRVFIGQQAIDAGLADEIISRDALVSRLTSAHNDRVANPSTPTYPIRTTSGAHHMAFNTFNTEAEYTAEISAAEARGKSQATVTQAQIDGAKAEALAAGAKAERERIIAIEALPLASVHKDVISKAKAEGTDPAATGLAILAAEGTAQKTHADARKEELPVPAAASHPDAATEAQQAREKETASADSKVNPAEHAARIRAHIATAKTQGRTIDAATADAELAAVTAK